MFLVAAVWSTRSREPRSPEVDAGASEQPRVPGAAERGVSAQDGLAPSQLVLVVCGESSSPREVEIAISWVAFSFVGRSRPPVDT